MINPNASNAESLPPPWRFACSSLALFSKALICTPWQWRGVARSCCCISIELLLLLLPPCSGHQCGPGSHPTQDRLQDCFICCALHYLTSWINVQEVLPDAGSTSYKDKLAELVQPHVLVQIVF